MKDDVELNHRLANRIRTLRATRGLSLDDLAGRSGVSRSMLSRVERAESSPTATLLDRIATGLGVTLSALFDEPAAVAGGGPLSRRGDQPEWRDPGSGYVRRNVSPPASVPPFQIVEVEFPAGAWVAFENVGRRTPLYQQVWVLDGTIEVTLGDVTHRLETGDCLAMTLDRPGVFRNPGRSPARYAVVIASAPEASR